MFMLLVATVLVATAASSTNSPGFEDCPTKLSTLERALYETGNNEFELNRVFFPPSVRASRFIRVNYTFLNEKGEDDGCSIAYIWAIGILLFFQPPKLFTYNSLYFNYPNNNLTTVYLKLPYECRPLININASEVDATKMCSCVSDSPKLDILTQQVDIYAKFSNQPNIERMHTFARAVCSEELEGIFYSGNLKFDFIIVCLTIILPFVFLAIFIIFVRNVHDDAIKTFTQPSKHGVLVSTTLCGILVSTAILVFDILACHVVVSGHHEYEKDLRGKSLNLYIVFGTLFCDLLFLVPLILGIIYIFAYNGKNVIKMCCKCDVTCAAQNWLKHSVIAIIVGKKTLERITKLSDDDMIAVMFAAMLVAPLLSFTSHVGYILLAWLTEPSKCTTVLILFYVLVIYFYLSFRKCYRHYAKIEVSCKFFKKCGSRVNRNCSEDNVDYESNNTIPLKQSIIENDTSVTGAENKSSLPNVQLRQSKSVDDSSIGSDVRDERYDCCCLTVSKIESKKINTQAFCFLFFFGFFFLGVVVMIIAVIIELPLSSEELATYLFNVFQLTIVIISTQYAYELYFASSFSFKHVFQKFRDVFAQKDSKKYNNDLVAIAKDYSNYSEVDEVTGAFAAELTDVVVQRFYGSDV